MPIPTKPLRELLFDHLDATLASYSDGTLEAVQAAVDAAMRTLAEYDPCFAKAAEKMEPTFTLRAQDRFAGAVVADWAGRADYAGVPESKCAEAVAIATAMRAWPNRKLPD